MAIIYVSEFVDRGSGYYRIAEGLAPRLDQKEPLYFLGLNYRGKFHDFNFTVVPTRADWIPYQINEMVGDESLSINKVVVALDLPVQSQRIMPFFPPQNRKGWRYIGIFPLDGGPLSRRFALPIQFMNEAFAISKFAYQCCRDLELDVQYLPIGMDMIHWGPAEKEQRKQYREEFEISDKFVVLFVGDNHERKYAVGAMEIFAEFSRDKSNTELWMVTRLGSPYGFDLEYYAQMWGIETKVKFWERKLQSEYLRIMYTAADVLLNTSKAEGLCVFPGSEVWSEFGLEQIENVTSGTKVLTHNGSLGNVEKTFEREYDGDLIVLQPRYGISPLRLTPNHLVFAIRRRRGTRVWGKKRLLTESAQWIPAHELKRGDFLFFPQTSVCKEPTLKFSDYIDVMGVDEEYIALIGRNQFGSEFPHPQSRKRKDSIAVDDDLLAIIGLYISEGCSTNDACIFAFHENEIKLQRKLKVALRRKFTITGTERIATRHRYSLWVYDSMLSRFLGSMCGKNAKEKHFPEWVLWLSKEQLWVVLESMFAGDGYYQRGQPQWSLRYSTISRRLAKELQFVLVKLGILSYIYEGTRSGRAEFDIRIFHPDLFKIPFLDHSEIPAVKKLSGRHQWIDGGVAIPIKSVKRINYKGLVYNLEIEREYSYVLAGGTVHNCLPILEAMSIGGAIPVGTRTSAIPELIEEGTGLLIEGEYNFWDVYGDTKRTFPSTEDGVAKLQLLYEASEDFREHMREFGRAYTRSRTWDYTVDTFYDIINLERPGIVMNRKVLS